MVTMASDLLKNFRFFFCNHWREFDKTLYRKQVLNSFTNFRVLGWSVNNDSCHGLKLSGTFRHLLCNGWTEFDKANPTSSTKFLIFGRTRQSIWPLCLCLGDTLSTSKNGFKSASNLLNPLFIYVPTATPIAEISSVLGYVILLRGISVKSIDFSHCWIRF